MARSDLGALVAGLVGKQGEASRTVQPIEDQAWIAENAASLLGTPYHADNGLVCTDLYVRSSGLAERIVADAREHPEQYSRFNERLGKLAKYAKRLAEAVGIGSFNNQPSNPRFPQRIQNVISWQVSRGAFTPNEDAPVGVGYAVYLNSGKTRIPDHMGVVVAVDSQGHPQHVIHASSRAGKVVRESLQDILAKGYTVAGFGYAPK